MISLFSNGFCVFFLFRLCCTKIFQLLSRKEYVVPFTSISLLFWLYLPTKAPFKAQTVILHCPKPNSFRLLFLTDSLSPRIQVFCYLLNLLPSFYIGTIVARIFAFCTVVSNSSEDLFYCLLSFFLSFFCTSFFFFLFGYILWFFFLRFIIPSFFDSFYFSFRLSYSIYLLLFLISLPSF